MGALIVAFLFPVVFAASFSLAKFVWQHIAIKHDFSALAYLGDAVSGNDADGMDTDDVAPHPADYANCPIYPDNPRYYQVEDTIFTDNNPMDVIGFVVGKPMWIEGPPDGGASGYYAELIVNWDRAEMFREWCHRGYGIQLAMLTKNGKPDLSRSDNRFLAMSPFSEDGKRVVNTITKVWEFRTFRCRPYKKYGFRFADDLENRQLSWQVSTSRWFAQTARSVYHGMRRRR